MRLLTVHPLRRDHGQVYVERAGQRAVRAHLSERQTGPRSCGLDTGCADATAWVWRRSSADALTCELYPSV